MAEKPQKVARGAPRSQKSHDAILKAALYLAQEGGPHALTVEAVARKAGVGKQTIYRWWPSRMDLLIEVYDAYAPPLQELDAGRALPMVLKTLFRTYHQGPAGKLLAALIALSQSDERAFNRFRTGFLRPRHEALMDYLVKSGSCDQGRAQAGADLVIAMIWYALLSDPQCLTDAYVDRICQQIGNAHLSKTADKEFVASGAHGKSGFAIHDGYCVGLAGSLITLHMDYYGPVWKFGRNFETLVTSDFGGLLHKYDPERDQLIRVEDEGGDIVGTLIVEAVGYPHDVARIRFFVLSKKARGLGLGQEMLEQAIDTCRQRGQVKLFLTTFKGLDAACVLYKRAGFTFTTEFDEDDWGEGRQEVRYDLVLS